MNTRKYLFEWEDLPWFPDMLRESMTDYLRFMFTHTNFYQPITPLILQGLTHSQSHQLVDLCSGGGGPIEVIKSNLEEVTGQPLPVLLTDKFPNLQAFRMLAERSKNQISYLQNAIDARDVPANIAGFRTIFSGFHHFDDEFAKAVLQNAVDNKAGIGIFDGGDKNLLSILLILILHPLAFVFLTPFFRPFRWTRIIFTYVIPLIPFFTIWDGIVSVTRLRSPQALLKLAQAVTSNGYHWEAGKRKNKWGMNVAYLLGYPIWL
ncbi:MAG: class I SAM-dependent methyltransferase [Chitinophagaceae bacterium]|nr:MAG: class I SAM-dependent methyltransferase [Chitinophagaceae bacterium]